MGGNRLAGLERRAAHVAAVRRRLDRWRWRRGRGRQIPPELRAAAVALAREHGTSHSARALGVSYQALKDRVAGRPPMRILIA